MNAGRLFKTDSRGVVLWEHSLAGTAVFLLSESVPGFITAHTQSNEVYLAEIIRLDGTPMLEVPSPVGGTLSADARPPGTVLLRSTPSSAILQTYDAAGALVSSNSFPAIYAFLSPTGVDLVQENGFLRLNEDLAVVSSANFPPAGYRAAVDAAYREPSGALVYIYGSLAYRFTPEGELQIFAPSLNDFRTLGATTFGSGVVTDERAWVITQGGVQVIRRVEAEQGTPYFFREEEVRSVNLGGSGTYTNHSAMVGAFTSQAPLKVAIKTRLHTIGRTTAQIYYTLDRSEPTTNSLRYTNAFTVDRTTDLRARVFHPELPAPLENRLSLNVTHPFKVTVSPWAAVAIVSENAGDRFARSSIYAASNEVVRIKATGTQPFLRWLGDAHGTNRILDLKIDSHKTVLGLFGQRLDIQGSGGRVFIDAEGPEHPRLPTRLHPVPDPGFRFVGWSSQDTITNNIVARETLTPITANFERLPEGAVTLSAGAFGPGDVMVEPAKVFYATGETVTLDARPSPGAAFLGWSDGESAATRTLTLNASTNVMASFAGPMPGGFGFALFKPPGRWEVRASAATGSFISLGVVTNTQPILHFVDPYSGENSVRYYHIRKLD